MSPIAITTSLFMVGPVLILFLCACIFRKKRVMLLSLAFCISMAEIVYLIWEKDNEKLTIMENIDAVEAHLQERYPGEEWILRRQEGVFLDHGGIEVIFLNELDEGYHYYVDDGKVRQSGGFSIEGADFERKHNEEN
ncbi:hypothetical protein [Domibacillus robiginosus]|uniref:hypothetical protein n=1 Tax=Domibacillus robiginosus TaxID=1071054 RepID=UPI00067D2617|nr:hypothetical protein [Domibacillus robiginosus]